MKKPTLTVALPVYNEEKSIESILQSLLHQELRNFSLKHILVYSDSSTDRTHAIVTRLSKKFPIIQLRRDKLRKGKYLRMGQMFEECKEDILVVLDADIQLDGVQFLENLSKVLLLDKKALMVSAHQVLIRPNTFIGKLIHTDFTLWDFIRWSIPEKHSANNFYASATAFRGSFARSIRIPSELTDPHLSLYLLADKKSGFRYCDDAVIYQWPITTIQDYQKFLRRSLGKKDMHLERLLRMNTDHVYDVARTYKIRGMLRSMLTYPIYTPLAILFNIYMHKIQNRRQDASAVWDIVTSTKKVGSISS